MNDLDPTPLPVVDLVDRLQLGLVRGGTLLTENERHVVDRVVALRGPPALLHARLASRRPAAFRLPELVAAGVDDVPAAAAALVEVGLATHDVPWATRAAEASVAVLADGCRRLGVPSRGRRPELEARLVEQQGWDDAPWLALPHRALLVRLERWATLQVAPDRSAPVLERLGRLRWVDHPVTDGGALVPSREDWLAWEALVDRLDTLTVEDALAALDGLAWPPGDLDLRGELRWRLTETARELERSGRLGEAEALYTAVRARGGGAELEVRRARVRELSGDEAGALALLEAARGDAGDVDRLALGRAGRRLAKRLGRAWAPDRPLLRPEERRIEVPRLPGTAPRPRYEVDGVAHTVEHAVAARLSAAGRRALPAEGALWRTVLGLLLGPVIFLPVPGQLPTPRLPGPLDHGRPGFAARRAAAVWDLVDDVRAGRAGARLAAGLTWLDGRIVAGVEPELTVPELVPLVDALGPDGLLAVLRPLLAEGRRAAAGLPDLVVLPGEAVRVEGLHPGRLGPGVVLVEVKGEQDAERDAQQVWFDRLVRAGVDVQVWRVAG